jgi:hypothetical protein
MSSYILEVFRNRFGLSVAGTFFYIMDKKIRPLHLKTYTANYYRVLLLYNTKKRSSPAFSKKKYYRVQTKVKKSKQADTGSMPPPKVNGKNYSILHWQTVEQ